jgi:hypothetical protein
MVEDLLDLWYLKERHNYGASMNQFQKTARASILVFLFGTFCSGADATDFDPGRDSTKVSSVIVHHATKYDLSPPFALAHTVVPSQRPEPKRKACCGLFPHFSEREEESNDPPPAPKPVITKAGAAVEQREPGKRSGPTLVESFDGLGLGFTGQDGAGTFKSPSDESLAAGPNHIVQIVNTRLAVYTKAGGRYSKTGEVLYGPVATSTLWAGFGGVCEARNNGDGVVRYDQLAGRWLFVMPIFTRTNSGDYPEGHGDAVHAGQASAPGAPSPLPLNPPPPEANPIAGKHAFSGPESEKPHGTFAMCYAVSVSDDPLGAYYRYAFERGLFPDYPRPAVWPDGYYIPTSTGDEVIQKHVCIADRTKMLHGQPATEQCIVIDGVSFLNNADIDGKELPPPGAPNIMMAAGGTQLQEVFEDDGIYFWNVHVDWNTPANTKVTGPEKITVAPYHFLCNGQLTSCVPQPGTKRRLDAQGDKLMQRLVYRKIGKHESIVAAHSVATRAGGGGVRWYEFRLDKQRNPYLYQQGTYAPDGFYRWMPSIAMDQKGDIGVGYSFGGTPNFTGQRFAARSAKDPKGTLSLRETVLANGEASQTTTLRWEDYVTTAVDPSDDCTFWYVGDYLKKGENSHYSSKIGSFRVPGCR